VSIAAKSRVVGSFEAARWGDPSAPLARYGRDEVEVTVVVEDRKGEFLGGRSHEQVRNLASSLAALSQESLDLERAAHVAGGRVDGLEGIKGSTSRSNSGRFAPSSRPPDRRWSTARVRLGGKRFYHPSNLGMPQPLDDAGVDHEAQRHASDRSSRSASPSTSSAAATRCACAALACRRAWFTVSLIVVVPSSA
jgi:hypothetical protein